MSSLLLSIYLILFIFSHTIHCETVTCNLIDPINPCSCTAISGEECILNCDGDNGACNRQALTCRDNDPCTINCDVKDGCRGASITCPANADCTLNCKTGNNVCSDGKASGPLFTVYTNNAKSYQCMSTTGACPPSPPFVPAPYTSSPTTAVPTTAAPSTSPTTSAPSASPTTASPTTSNPTSHPSTSQPTTTSPTTATPTTSNPTATPTTSNPTTSAPTFPPTTSAPTTSAPTTSDPTTATPTTSNPTTSSPTTAVPTTISPTTANPTSASPTVSPSTSQPTQSNTNTNTPQQTTTVISTATTKLATSNDENTAGAGYKNSNPNTTTYGIIAGLVALVIVMFAACLVYRHFLRKKEAQMEVLFGSKAMPRQLSDIVNETNAKETTSPPVPETTISPPMEGEGDANTTQIRYYGYDERVRSATVATNPLHFTQNANSRRGTDISQRSHQPYVNYAAHQQMYQHPQKNMYPVASHSQRSFHAAQQQMHQQNMYAQSVRNMNQNVQHGQNNSYPTQPHFDVAAYYANYGGSQQNMQQNAGHNQQPSGQSQHPQQQLSAECQVISPMATEDDTGAFPADIHHFVFGDADQEEREEHDEEEKHDVLHEEDGTEGSDGSESEESGETESDSDSHHTHTKFERANTILPYMHSDNTLRGFIKNDIKMHTGNDQVELQPLDDINEDDVNEDDVNEDDVNEDDVNEDDVNEDNHNRDMTILSDISDMNLEFTTLSNVLSFKE